MDILRRSMAPIDAAAWSQIDDMARQALLTHLSARKFVDVAGPFGIGHACVTLGRLEMPKGQKANGLQYGIHQVQPLVEARFPFTVDQWELDNIGRGAKDVQLDSLIEAAREIARFEEEAIYKGFKPAGIPGIAAALDGKPVPLQLDVHALIDAVSEGQTRLIAAGVEGNSSLVASPAIWKFMARNTQGGTVRDLIERQIGGKVIYSATVDGALLVSQRGGDFELTLGQDLSIGYKCHDTKSIHLYISESFTFRVITPEAMVAFAVA
ncbi:MAG: family 1 encapsulin nanocompartment shell protein [Lentisphaeria bacterium]|jgi:uncharacterized linocin/CFP29 family protein|nr:family 1 encapsulin nanocompartment shell protein [Lentisphaeria bacterium]